MLHAQPNPENQKTELVSLLKQSLEHNYPESDGWKHYNRYNWSSRNFDLILQREDNDGEIYRIVVCVNFDHSITKEEYTTVSKLARRLNHGTSVIMKKMLVVDDLAMVAKGPSDIEVVQIGKMLSESQSTEPKLVA